MTTLETWIDFCTDVMAENIKICSMHAKNQDLDFLMSQAIAFRKHLDSYIDFLKRIKNEQGQ